MSFFPRTRAHSAIIFFMLLFLAAAFLLSGHREAGAGENTPDAKNVVTVSLFWGRGCPHCNSEKQFLETLKRKYPRLEIKEYEVWHNEKNAALFAKVLKAGGVRSSAVPAAIVDQKLFIGFNDPTGREIENSIVACIKKPGCIDAVQALTAMPLKTEQDQPKAIQVPLIGEVNPGQMSLPLFTVIIGLFDSFNPCAFFVLLFLLSLLIHARSRKKMLLIGGIFVFFSGSIYFMFMAAWLNIFLIIGRLTVITAIAGLVALTAASINVKDFFFFKKGVSLTIPESSKPKLFERMRNLIKSPTTPAMAGGAIVLAISANAYELLCTAGFPMLYTRVLTLHSLSTVQYYLYLALYNVVYVIPLAVIVIVVTATLGARKLSEWQGRQLKLISGLMMFFLGLLLLINPALLNNVIASVVLLAAALLLSGIIIVATKRLKPEIARD